MEQRPYKIPLKQARRLAIWSAGLFGSRPFGYSRKALIRTIRHLGFVQIDTIHVIRRAHHHMLFSRIPDYQASHLNHYHFKTKQIFEYWWHAAAYLPIEDFRFTLRRKAYFSDKLDRWPKPSSELCREVLDRIIREGPLMAKDFEDIRPAGGSGWWSHKPAKWALERLFMEGRLMVVCRKGFQKVYDLTEKVYPESTLLTVPSEEEFADHLISRTLQIHGITSADEICYLRRGIRKMVLSRLHHMIRIKKVVPLNIHGRSKEYYALLTSMDGNPHRIGKQVRILSPFDPMVIQRKRIKELFNFNYQLECYLPRTQRKFGYFVLPVIKGDRFVARIDIKAHRHRSALEIKSIHWEDHRAKAFVGEEELLNALADFARFNKCKSLEWNDHIEKPIQA